MPRSISSILSQIERLQMEAASIQSEVINRIRKEIAKYGLTAEQLFGDAKAASRRTTKKTRSAASSKPAKYADSSGNTWAGMGKRPDWLRNALAAGHSLDDFLNDGSRPKTASTAQSDESVVRTKRKRSAGNRSAQTGRTASKRSARKPRTSDATVAGG